LDNVVRAIRVTDAHGDELTLYEYQHPVVYRALMGLKRRLALDTGEEAEWVDDDTFVLVSSGETLRRVR
jgi:hypothetical protein